MAQPVLSGSAEGAAVAVCGRTQKRIEEFNQECCAAGVTVFAAQADAGNIEELQRFADEVLAKYGRIDVWINNAGINIGKKLMDITLPDWEKWYGSI